MHTTTDLQHIFGRQTLILTRRWEKFAQRQAATFEQLTFLHRCRDHDVLPKSLRFKPTLPNETGRFLACKYGWRVLSAIISDVHNRLRRFEAILADLKNQCASALPENVFNNVQQRINATTKDARLKKRVDLQEKLQSLLRPTNERSMTTRVVNLSKRILSPAEISLLSKGIGFNHTDATPTNFLAGLESVLLASALPEDKRADIRSCATGILRQKRRQQTLPADEAQGLQSLKSDHNIVVLPADKGGATVIMDRIDYVNKANEIFSDVAAYTPLAEDPTKKQAAAIKKKVTELARLKVISPDDSKLMTLSDPHIARAYGLPKVHKVDVPLRIIVPLIGSPTYNIAKWLYRHLKQLTHGSDYSINNSHAFLQRIQGLKVSADECLLSFDVVALFSSIPHDLAIECVAQRLQDNPVEIPTQHIIELLKLCLRNYCQFDNKFYQQVKGTPMGSPISGLLAELVLQRLEKEVFQNLSPKVWLRYVDDTFVVVKNCEVERLHQRLNDVFPDIQFTREVAIGDSLPFLDVRIQRLSDGSLATSVHRKGSNSEIILNYGSNHPAAHKRSCVRTLFHRAYRYCNSDDLLKKELAYLYRLFRSNGYPTSFVKNCLRHQAQPQGPTLNGEIVSRQFFSLPYMQGTSEVIARQLNRSGIHIAHKPASSLRAALSRIKDPLPKEQQTNVIYRIPCSNCSCVYVGHTGRSLGTRIKEHKLAVRRRDPLSLVFAHALECDHRFNWDGTEVVAMANTKRAREFLEAWYSNAGSINRHVDLDAHYEGLRSRLTAPCPNHASTTANTEARSPTDSPPTLPLQHSVP
ncbi:hypothetical protein SprV_0100464200 [Sparganum proliferum]